MTDASTPTASGRIFVSYRREETAYPAGWLYDRLTDRFGAGQVFKDVDSIQLGDDFVDVITGAVGSCDVLLALIGLDWLTVTDARGARRLDDTEDFVRLEIEAALSRKVRVIPILVDGAVMPRVDQLPPSLAGLGRRQALELSPNRFEFDTHRLLRVLDETLAEVHGASPGLPQPRPAPVAPMDERREGSPSRGLTPRTRLVAVAGAAVVVALVAVLVLRPGDSTELTLNDAPTTAQGLRLSGLRASSAHQPPEVADRVAVSFTLTNATSSQVRLDEIFVGVRDAADVNKDETASPSTATLGAGESVDVTASVTVDRDGLWTFWPCYDGSPGECPDEWQKFTFVTP